MKKWIKRIVIGIGGLGLTILISYQVVTHTPFYKNLCKTAYDKLATMSEGTFRKYSNTQIFDKDGNLIGEIDGGSYVYSPISEIPLNLQNAYIAAEDQSFKEHQGIDWKGIARAGLSLIKNKGEITQGGSTITQQVIKNNLLSQEQSFTRKFLEILIAPKLEQKYTKQDIMEFYCNSNYYGNGCYGVGSAANYYFGKDIKELTLAECAMLAGVSNSPNNYNPVTDMKLAKKKMSQVLNQMEEQKMITASEKKKAKEQEIVVTQTVKETDFTNYQSSYAIHCAILELMDDDYNETSSMIYEGGYKIYTSLDSNLQSSMQEVVDQSLSANQEIQENGKYNLQAAGVCVDNETGYVVAIVGGRGKDQFNRGFLANRQPGSTIKPLLDYGPAFDLGIASPSSIYNDKKTEVNGYAPQNANRSYLGNMNLREALARSINTIPLQLFQQVGQKNALSYLEKMNFSTLSEADYTAPSICLGGFTNGVTVTDMAKAYYTLENHGSYNERTCIQKIEKENVGTVYDGENEKSKQIYNQDTAFMLTDMMQGVLLEGYGTAYKTDVNGQIVAGKTGTTNEDRDSWFCGYSQYYTTSVWVGNDDNAPLSNTTYSNTIWTEYMKRAHEGKEVKDFDIPDTIEYRNVLEGGVLGSKIAEGLDTGKRTYYRRPSGYDLYSTTLSKEANANQKKYLEQQKEEEVKALIDQFLSYKITDIDTAKKLDITYNDAIAKIDTLKNKEKQTEYKETISKKYKVLKKVQKQWETKIEEAEENEAKQQAAEQSASDESDYEASVEAVKQNRISIMREYIQLLSKRKYNTDQAQRLLSDAYGCLDRCKEYEEYIELKKAYDEQEARISKLPTELPKPEEPELPPIELPDPIPEKALP